MLSTRAWAVVAIFSVAWQIGCGPAEPDRATIHGQVTYQGQPVPFGYIVFIPQDGWEGFYSQAKILQGVYSLEEHGPILGRNRVEIHGYRKTGEQAPDVSGVRLDKPTEMVEATEPYLPLKYNVASELAIVIQEGRNDQVDFHLE